MAVHRSPDKDLLCWSYLTRPLTSSDDVQVSHLLRNRRPVVTFTAVGQAANLHTPVICRVVSSVVDTSMPRRRQFSASFLESIQGLTCVLDPSTRHRRDFLEAGARLTKHHVEGANAVPKLPRLTRHLDSLTAASTASRRRGVALQRRRGDRLKLKLTFHAESARLR